MAQIKSSFIVRKATAEDMKFVRDMIQELADFEKMSNGPKLSTEDLTRDAGLSGQQEFFHCYIVEETMSGGASATRPLTRTIIGYSICFFSYSTWEGRSYFLEDLYIKPDYRMKGAGQKLFCYVVKMAREYNCQRLDFHVLNWNPARNFYEKMGAVNLTNKENWHMFRMDQTQMQNLLSE